MRFLYETIKGEKRIESVNENENRENKKLMSFKNTFCNKKWQLQK